MANDFYIQVSENEFNGIIARVQNSGGDYRIEDISTDPPFQIFYWTPDTIFGFVTLGESGNIYMVLTIYRLNS